MILLKHTRHCLLLAFSNDETPSEPTLPKTGSTLLMGPQASTLSSFLSWYEEKELSKGPCVQLTDSIHPFSSHRIGNFAAERIQLSLQDGQRACM